MLSNQTSPLKLGVEIRVPNQRSPRQSLLVGFWLVCTLTIYGCVVAAILSPASRQPSSLPLLARIGSIPLANPAAVNAQAGFMDADILLWGAEKFQAKQDPLDSRFFGESNIYYNYPSGWRFLALLGLRRSDTQALGIFFAVVYAAALWWILPPINGRACLLHLLIVASPATLNVIGEGNGELLVAALLAVSIKFATKRNAFSDAISLGSLVWASLLKLYPAVCFGGLVLLMRRRKWIPFLIGVLVAGWFFWTSADIKTVIERTPKPFLNGFGCEMLPVRAQTLIDAPWLYSASWASEVIKLFANREAMFRVVFFLVVGGFVGIGYRGNAKRPGNIISDDDQALLLFGALIFIGSFGIGNSWNHRLIASVPWLMATFHRQNRVGMTTLFAATLWFATFNSDTWFLSEQVVFWVVLSICAFQVGKVSHQLVAENRIERRGV